VKILLADDDPVLRRSVGTAMRLEDYEVLQAANGRDALAVHAEHEPDAVVLDVMMPGLDGLAVCRLLRDAGDRTPILLLTAKGAVDDRVAGLDAGADDYLAKPFDLAELLARLRALLRRSTGRLSSCLAFGDLDVDTASRTGHRGGRPIEFTATEFALLELFLLNPNQVLTRDLIYDRVWGPGFSPAADSIAVYVSYLRGKLEAAGEPRIIHTVRGVGYRLAPR
jgi:two-component system response regulator MprA